MSSFNSKRFHQEYTNNFSVRLDPNVTYGAIQLWNDNKYHLICADGFDDMAAKVVCRSMGYQNGISVCCSAFGSMNLPITYHNVSCTGKELWILGCKYKTGVDGCASKQYASVTCSNVPASGGKPGLKHVYRLKIPPFENVESMRSRYVKMRILQQCI